MTMTSAPKPMTLVSPDVLARWEAEYERGMDKRFPSLELVRLERWYFEGRPGRALEYGFGTGVNLLYLLERGYQVEGVDACRGALRMAEQKLAQRPELRSRVTLTQIAPNAVTLPFADASLDYVVCLSVLSLLGSRERAAWLVSELHRVMKPGAKLLIDINSAESDFAKRGTPLGEDIYEYRGGRDDQPIHCYCPSSGEALRTLLAAFTVDDVGYAAYRYLGRDSYEPIACARKP